MATLHRASPSVPFVQQHLLIPGQCDQVCHSLIIISIFQILRQQKDYDLLKVQMMVSILAIKYFKIKIHILFLRHDDIRHQRGYTVL